MKKRMRKRQRTRKEDKVFVYVAHAMSGRSWEEVKDESRKVKKILRKYKIEVIDPIDVENDLLSSSVGSKGKKIPNRPNAGGKKAWYGDKKAIRKAHVVLDITPEMKSEGVLRELGYARFYLWKPVLRLYKKKSNPHMITVFEDDAVIRSLRQFVTLVKKKWGTREKRVKWRKRLLDKHLDTFITHQMEEFK